jgi:NAD(P)H-hydrate epimerase
MDLLSDQARLPDGFAPVFSTAAMREADRRTMDEAGLPGAVLMETAGRGVAQRVAEQLGSLEGRRIAVLAGKGNNGGDGLVVARVLAQAGGTVTVAATMREAEASHDAARTLRLARRIARHAPERLRLIPVREGFDLDRFDRTMREDGDFDLVVDALLGIGASGPLRIPVEGLCSWANRQDAPTVALDVPSGIDSDTGEAAAGAIRAGATYCMAALKPGVLFGDGARHAGSVEVIPIGVPDDLRETAMRAAGSARLTTDAGIGRLLPRRAADAHKYSAGMVLAVVGSGPFAGAAALACGSAARSGAGYVVAATPAAARDLVRTHSPEISTPDLPGPDSHLTDDALDAVLEQAEKAKGLLVGPGLGQYEGTQRFVRRLLASVRPDLPIVLDADGLNAVAADGDAPGFFREHARGRLLLTPHLGELRRLVADDDFEPSKRIEAAARLASAWNAALLLKGMPSVVAGPDGTAFVGGTGGPALATAGTGDVLAGLSAGLLAQGLLPLHAGACALHLGGRAAERYAATRQGRTMLATDVLTTLPYVFTA